jgi:23S rRNA (cytidine1920-2'-O)/16S rRNA (cytidine1409-2'-O)-methyltransferase
MNSKTLIHKKQRLDALLVALNIAETRSRAQQFIRGGHVRVDGKMCTKSGTLMQEELSIEVDKNAIPYVSRGGIKLAYALSVFNIDVTAKVCLDIGASTGGFTDCLLKHGAKFVYAIDVGHGQLHSSLRDNPHVSYIEGIDIRAFHLPKK